jgi:hypothetical protein
MFARDKEVFVELMVFVRAIPLNPPSKGGL